MYFFSAEKPSSILSKKKWYDDDDDSDNVGDTVTGYGGGGVPHGDVVIITNLHWHTALPQALGEELELYYHNSAKCILFTHFANKENGIALEDKHIKLLAQICLASKARLWPGSV